MGDNVEGSTSFSVESHVLGKALGKHDLEPLFDEISDGPGVLLKVSSGEALIGRVEEGNQRVSLANFSDFLPLFSGGINSSGVMGAGVEEDDGSRNGVVEELDHGRDVRSSGLGVVVRILDPFKSSVFDNVLMVKPGGVGKIDEPGEILAEESESETQGSSSGNGLASGDSFVLDDAAVFSEDQVSGT